MTLKELRKNMAFRQEDIAKKLNVDQAAISHWENGENIPSRKYWAKLAKLYNCTMDELATAIARSREEARR